MSEPSMLALRLVDVCSGYGPVEVLHRVSFDLEVGGSLALLGVNGAGKTTLANTVSGAIPLRSGMIELHGEPIGRLSASARARAGLGMIPEGRGILPSLSVLDNVRSALVGLGFRRSAVRTGVEEAISRFPVLKAHMKQRAGTLSGGEQQMLAVARILARKPRLIIADEISMGLAPMIVDGLVNELKKVNEQGVTVILIEQFAGRALAATERTVVLRRGEVGWAGTTSEVSGRLLTEYLGEQALDLQSGRAATVK